MSEIKPVIPHKSETYFDTKSQIKAGLFWLGIFAFVVLIWGGLSQISGAVVASGRVVNETNIKKIQHREGGIVREIMVTEGQIVKRGQVLLKLDPTVTIANEDSVDSQIKQLTARRLRLIAERDHISPASITIDATMPQDLQNMILSERALMATRLNTRAQKKTQYREQILQTNHEIGGNQNQIAELNKQLALVRQELKGIKEVYDQGYASFTRVSEAERAVSQIQAQISQLNSANAQARAKISQIQEAILQTDSESLTEVLNDLKETEANLAKLKSENITAQDAAKRLDVIAPVDGKVQQLNVHTKGGVISPAEVLMFIVPANDDLIIEARVGPDKIDDIRPDAIAHLRFTSFDTRTTPEAIGHIETLPSDAENDEKTGQSFYRVRIRLDKGMIPKNIVGKIVAGQPVEVQIETTSRNALSYFIKPLTDQMARTIKED